MRRIVILLVAILVTIAAGAALVILRGAGARNEPSGIETSVARTLRHFAIPSALRDSKNPVPLTEEVLAQGRAHWADHCAICHANDGSGDTAIGKGLYPKPPDLREAQTQNLTDGELYYIIHHGVRLTGMPAFGEDIPGKSDLDSWKLVHFIRYLPRITPEELERMKGMNPKSPHELEEEEAIRRFLEGDDSQPPVPNHNHH